MRLSPEAIGGFMTKARRLVITFAAAGALSACERKPAWPTRPSAHTPQTPSAPSAPAPAPATPSVTGDIRITSMIPEPGATLSVRDCTLPGSNYIFLCVDHSQMTFDVVIDRDVPDGILAAGF